MAKVGEGSQGGDGETVPLEGGNPSGMEDEEEPHKSSHKAIGTWEAVLLVIGALAGTGIIALPSALGHAGWTGLVLLLVGMLAAGYCAILLSRCWVILQERYPEARVKTRNPFPLIAEKAVGTWMRNLVTVAVCVSGFGISVVLILISAQNLELLFRDVGVRISQCYWILILAAVLTPFSWLDSPKDFWLTGLFSVLCAAAVSGSVTIKLSMEIADGVKGIPETDPSASGVFNAIGKILYSSAGALYYPTIQHDMRKPRRFSLALVYGYIGITALYLPPAILGYYAYGRDLKESILLNLPGGPLRTVGQIAITSHGLFNCLLSLNPVMQAMDRVAGNGEEMTWKKCLSRSSLMLLAVFVMESIPRIGVLIDLVGGSALAFLALAPSVLYMCLCSQKGDWPDRSIPLHTKVLCIELALVGVLLGCAATYSAIVEIVSTGSETFVPPCYINVNVGQLTT